MAKKTLTTRQKMTYRAPAALPAVPRGQPPMQGGKRKRGAPLPQPGASAPRR